MRRRSSSAIIAHNHPSGDPTPSEADIKITRDVIRAGQLLKIEVLDRIVLGHPNHVSLRNLGYFLWCRIMSSSRGGSSKSLMVRPFFVSSTRHNQSPVELTRLIRENPLLDLLLLRLLDLSPVVHQSFES